MGNVSLVDVGKLSKPATVLVEKISSAIGILYEPTRIKKKAIADAEVSKTKALMDLEIDDIQKRALHRLVSEEIKKQENIESITEKSFSSLNEDAKPEDIEDDWISNFFDKCKLISDKEMQELWGRVLASESNKPGSFSKRTVEFMSTMDKKDAELFENLGQFFWLAGEFTPFTINYENEIFKRKNLTFDSLRHLDSIGLVSFEPLSGFRLEATNNQISTIIYFERSLDINFSNIDKSFLCGHTLLTKIGQDLAQTIFTFKNKKKNYTKENDSIYHYIVKKLYSGGMILSEPLSNRKYFNKFI